MLAAISLVVIILMQQSEGDGGPSAITGIQDSYYSQNKGATRDGRLKRATVWLSVFIAVAIVVFYVLTEIYPGSLWS